MTYRDIIVIGAGIAGPEKGCYGHMNDYRTQIFELLNKPGALCTSGRRRAIPWTEGSTDWSAPGPAAASTASGGNWGLCREEKKQLAVTAMGRLEKPFPGITERLEVIDVATPMTCERTENWQGCREG